MRIGICALLVLSSVSTFAAPKPASQNKKHDFDAQTVEGEVYRPDYSVVTGDAPGEGWGVLRLRPDFDDHVVSDREEKAAQGAKR